MRPDPTHPEEVGGVLNPGAARGPDGELYLFTRLVAENNYSRIGIARVIFDDDGIPIDVERLGYALEPEEPYELRPRDGTGGCEDPRVTFVEPLRLYVMTYVAWGPRGPRVALAISENCLDWERLGLVDFQPDVEAHYGILFNHYDNKDAAFSPDSIVTPEGRVLLGMFHRPVYNRANAPKGITLPLPSIWFSGCDLADVMHNVRNLCIMNRHHLIAEPASCWEALRIGIGTPPVRTRLGYMVVYHGVSGEHYDAGVMLFRREKDRLLRYRSTTPILIPELEEETTGVVNNVVFPTGIDKRAEDIYDIYYGMADKYIGVARLQLPDKVDYDEAAPAKKIDRAVKACYVSRMPRKAKHAENETGRRERILEAARKLIAEHGFEATSTKVIAAEAGVPSGLVFYYFETKDALIEAIIDEAPTVVENAIARAQNRSLEAVLRAYYDDLLEIRYLTQIVVAAVASSHPIAQKVLRNMRRALSSLTAYFRSHSSGSAAVKPEVLAEVVNASMITAVLINRPKDVSSFIRGLASVVRSGLASPSP